MVKLQIEVIIADNIQKETLKRIINEANSLQDGFIYFDMEKTYPYAFALLAHQKTTTEQFFDDIIKIKTRIRGYHPFIIVITNVELKGKEFDNIFGDNDIEHGLAIFTTADVEDIIIPANKMGAYFLYYLARYTLSFIVPNQENHDQTEGCLFDRKIHKRDIIKSMKRGSICNTCRTKLLNGKNTLDPVQFEAINKLLDASSKYLSDATPQSHNSNKPHIFIGSSKEGLPIASTIQSELNQDFDIETWEQSPIFSLGTTTIEALEDAVIKYDFGVFVFTPDDTLYKKGEKKMVQRDNVLFELGLFMGKLTRFRAFVIHPEGMSLPSDLFSIYTARYDPNSGNLNTALASACQKIRDAITEANHHNKIL